MAYSIRLAESEDLETIQQLSVRLSEKEQKEFDPTIDPDWNTTEEAMKYFKDRVEDEDGFAMVAEADSEIVGYAVGGLRGAESYRNDLDIAELETMFVRPKYRSQGIGSDFMSEFEIWADRKNADRLRVEVTSQNSGGRRFYKREGLEDYARIMEKEL
jgi:GNAT superfamily N-acetyltransferase